MHEKRKNLACSRQRKSNSLRHYDIRLSNQELDALVRLLEFAESDIQRIFKRFGSDDIDLKEIYYYYRYSGRSLRKKFRNLRGY